MILLDKKPLWVVPGGEQLTAEKFMSEAKDLITRGSKVYVGTDSMAKGSSCIFVTVVAFHNNERKIAKYYYKKFSEQFHYLVVWKLLKNLVAWTFVQAPRPHHTFCRIGFKIV